MEQNLANPQGHIPPPNETAADRVRWLLEHHWSGNQSHMAKAVDCTQSLISRVVNGVQPPGRRLLDRISKHPNVNTVWLFTGQGEPLVLGSDRSSLPISTEILPGNPTEYADLLLPERYPVRPDEYRDSRYWLRVTAKQTIVRAPLIKLADGDLLMMESDRSAVSPRPSSERLPGGRAVARGRRNSSSALLDVPEIPGPAGSLRQPLRSGIKSPTIDQADDHRRA